MHVLASLSKASQCPRTPRLFIHTDAWAKLRSYVDLSAPNEVNGFGLVEQWGGDFVIKSVEEIMIIKQLVSPGTADNDPTSFAKLHHQMSQHGRADDLRLQWHSHVHGQAYFSDIDTRNIDRYGDSGAEWMLSLVTNVRGEVQARFDQFQPVRVGIEIETVLFMGMDDSMLGVVEQEIKDLVTVMPKPRRRRKPSATQTPVGLLTDEIDEFADLSSAPAAITYSS